MSISDKLTAIAENEQKVYDAGRMLGQSDIWDMVQNFGNRTNYGCAFDRWSGKNFNPKYPMQPTSCESMFNFFASGDAETVDLRGVDLDTSKSTSFSYMCNGGKVSAFGAIDTTSASEIKNVFYNARDLHTVEVFILKEDGSQAAGSNVFRNCGELVNIVIQGKWGKSISAQYSTKLSKDSIFSFVNALLDTATEQTLTLSKTAVNKAFETSEDAKDGSTSAEWSALVATKPNWTISLV